MGYTSLKTYTHCKEEGCTNFRVLGLDGFCWAHADENLKLEFDNKRHKYSKKLQQSRGSIITRLRHDNNESEVVVRKKETELWYRLQMNSNEKICDNCGLSLAHYNDWAWRSSQNHIVDKSPLNGCPSVALHPLNCNVLGMWCCHGQWGTSFLNQSKMNCFPAAKEKFELFKNAIAPDELRKVNPYLLS